MATVRKAKLQLGSSKLRNHLILLSVLGSLSSCGRTVVEGVSASYSAGGVSSTTVGGAEPGAGSEGASTIASTESHEATSSGSTSGTTADAVISASASSGPSNATASTGSSMPNLSETCDPVLFSSQHDFPSGFALHGDVVFWTVHGSCPLGPDPRSSSGKVMGARKVDGANVLEIRGVPCPNQIAAIDGDLYWTNDPITSGEGSIWAATIDGQNARAIATGLISPSTIRADASHIYWFDQDGIYRMARDNLSEVQVFTPIDRLRASVTSAFVLDDDYVYWIDAGGVRGEVLRAPKAGGEPEVLAEAKEPSEVAISEAGLFWLEEMAFRDFRLSMLPRGEDSPHVLAESLASSQALAAVGDQAYWVQTNDIAAPVGGVYKVGSGMMGEPVLIAGEQVGPGAITADEDYVFWGNYTGLQSKGEIFRVCR